MPALALCLQCGEGPPPSASESLSFDSITHAVFAKRCTFKACHGEQSNQPLHLEPATAYDNLVGVMSTESPGTLRINPGDPDTSYLYLKISQASPPVGDRMPPGQPLEPELIDGIRGWIVNGANK
jgi:hypothetical protein